MLDCFFKLLPAIIILIPVTLDQFLSSHSIHIFLLQLTNAGFFRA
ncbi:hypothetical protein T266_09630 [Pseudomonas aeruginosa VRFPA05]|nr:hypothetical protein T266_09630 [Pseudomonas aeruginosa VRFPA05]